MSVRRRLVLIVVVAALWAVSGCQIVDPTERMGDQLDDIFRDERLHDLSG